MFDMTKEQIQAVTVISWFKRSNKLLFLIPHPNQEEKKPPLVFSTEFGGGNEGYLAIVQLMGQLVGVPFVRDGHYSTENVQHFVKEGCRIEDTETRYPLPTTRKRILGKGG